jgi:glycosyltransferase involved in cell wall biosynthesis
VRSRGATPGYRPKVLIIGPLPPPYFGVAKATRLMLESTTLADRLQIVHLDTSDRLGFAKMGSLDWRNTYLGLKHVVELVRLLRKEQPDVVLLTVSQGKFALIRDGLFVSLSRTYEARTVTYLRGSGYAEMRERQGRIAAWVLRSILKHSSRVIVLGQSLVAMAHTVSPTSRVAVVTNGCPPAVAPGQIGIRNENRPVIAYIGRLSREKGLDDALLAARSIAASIPSLEFVLRGEWDSPVYESATMALVAEYGLSDIVRFPGPVSIDEKAEVLADAWVLLVPSHSEGQPWVILEAMSAGVPVVAADTGAVCETVRNGFTGFVVPIADVASLSKCVVDLLADDDLWKRMSDASVQEYRDRFTVEHSHDLLAEELCQVAQEERG